MLRDFFPSVQSDFLLDLISRGWRIFPLHRMIWNYDLTIPKCSCRRGLICPRMGKCPLVKWGDLANYPEPGGVKLYLSDGHNGWAVHLGHSRLVCADFDPRNGGPSDPAEIEKRYGTFRTTARCETGAGGWHFYFRAPPGVHPIRGMMLPTGYRSTSIQIDDGVEILSGQHFTVLPYSTHKSGNEYVPHDFSSLDCFPEVNPDVEEIC